MGIPFEIIAGTAESDDPFSWDEAINVTAPEQNSPGLFEEATRVPFIISVPWLTDQHGRGTTEITELVDLFPTLTELAGIPAPENLQGTSLKSLLVDTESPEWKKEAAFTISRSGGESLRTNDYRFTQWGFGDDGLELTT